jgi:hypothetical protein
MSSGQAAAKRGFGGEHICVYLFRLLKFWNFDNHPYIAASNPYL